MSRVESHTACRESNPRLGEVFHPGKPDSGVHYLGGWAILSCVLISPVGLLPVPTCGELNNETGDWSLTVTPTVVRPEVETFSAASAESYIWCSCVLFSLSLLFFWLHPTAYRALGPWSGIDWTLTKAVKAPSPNHWTARELPLQCSFFFFFAMFF